MQKSKTQQIKIEDVIATLTRFSAETAADAIFDAVRQSDSKNDDYVIYVSGGGVHNPLLMEFLKELVPYSFKKTDELGISGDAKEALLFAVLANETVAGSPTDFGSRKGIPSVTMGKISFPN
jgi:anhydro-N-acetylmuramic acid kinase